MNGARSGSDQLGFGDDDIEQTVVRFKRHVGDLLDRIGEPDGQNRVLASRCGDGAVEMALAVADPASSAVEGGEGNEKCRGEDFGRIGPWLAHAESALDEGSPGCQSRKLRWGWMICESATSWPRATSASMSGRGSTSLRMGQ